MKPYVIRNFLDAHMLLLLQLQVAHFKSDKGFQLGVGEDRTVFFRKQVHNPALFKALHNVFLMTGKEYFPEKVKPTYCFVSMYDEPRSICPKHIDRPQCKYTIDVCLDQKEPWEIFINDEPFILNPGDAVIYSGTDHPHYRNQIAEGNFCDLAFFHYCPIDYQGELD